MKNHPIIFLILATLLPAAFAEDTMSRVDRNARLINMAILTLPDHLVSGLPKTERGGLLKLFCAEGRYRLDYGNGFVDYNRDGAAAWDEPSGKCRFWMKLFYADDGTAFLFVHNYRNDSARKLTAFFRCGKYGGDFEDVTSDYFPKELDLANHFRPRRESDIIRVAEYEEHRLDGKAMIFTRIGPQTAELFWNGKGFELRKTARTVIPHLDKPSRVVETQGEQDAAAKPIQEQGKPKVPSFLMGQVAGERLILHILPEGASPELRKLKGTRSINVEPGCIMLEAYVKLIGDTKLEIRMPHDDGFTSRTMKKMGVKSKSVVVTFEPSDRPSLAGSIESISPSENKSSEQGAAPKR